MYLFSLLFWPKKEENLVTPKSTGRQQVGFSSLAWDTPRDGAAAASLENLFQGLTSKSFFPISRFPVWRRSSCPVTPFPHPKSLNWGKTGTSWGKAKLWMPPDEGHRSGIGHLGFGHNTTCWIHGFWNGHLVLEEIKGSLKLELAFLPWNQPHTSSE